jgi:2-methylisocitrate lyase-like PEP mutase family enzyme
MRDEILIQPGIYDGFSARLEQQMGFKSAAISGAGLSGTNLCWTDVGLMGYEENLHASCAIAACVDNPVPADADTGYGNAINLYFTVRGFEAVGVDGIVLEDQLLPKRCGYMAGKEVISAEEAADKTRAVIEARRDSDFIIKARTDPTGARICRSRMRCCRATTLPWWHAR